MRQFEDVLADTGREVGTSRKSRQPIAGLTRRRREKLPSIGVFRLWEKIKVPRRNPHWKKEHMQTPR